MNKDKFRDYIKEILSKVDDKNIVNVSNYMKNIIDFETEIELKYAEINLR